MKLLVLGGPRFLGRHLTQAALARGHRVTLFHRGRTGPDLFPEAEKLFGDRAADLALLDGRAWDAAIDTCGFLPQVVRQAVDRLLRSAGHYTFVSSVSVYEDFSRPGLDEQAPARRLTPEQWEEIETFDRSDPASAPGFGALYGPLKTECERVVLDEFAGRSAVVRPGLIVGPHDYMDRFPWWVARVAEGGEVLAPGRPERPVQVVDARDLADWMLRLAEGGVSGVFNATGPAAPLPMREVLETCRDASGSDARFTWVDEAFLVEREVPPWDGLPLWVPETTSTDWAGILQIDVRRAVASGLGFRPLVETARDTLAWERTRGPHAWRAGVERDRERALLAEWRQAARV